MKNTIILISAILLLFSCNENSNKERIYVKDILELNKAIKEAVAGDEIVLRNGIWKDAQINFYGVGTKEKPITLRAETPGSVFIEGQSYIHLGGENLIVDGLYFRNGYSPAISIVRFKIGNDSTAFNSTVTNCVIKNFTKPSRLTNDHWIEFYGKHNKLDHSYISGKSNDGETIRIFYDGMKNTSNHHQIVHNYFGPRPRKGGPRAETIRNGDSTTSMSSGFLNVSDNYFEACNGEVEIISDKTNFNTFKNNIFYKCEGSLVLRHGSFATVDRNFFIGDDDSDFYGGIRVVSSGHTITNNYFYKINGAKFRSPLAIMNGIPYSPIHRYKQVTDVIVAYNTWIDCKSPFQIGVGQNLKSVDVLPKSEIRSAPPIRSVIANNLIYNHESDATPFINHDNMDGINFQNNILDNNGTAFTQFGVFQNDEIKIKQVNEWLFVPEQTQSTVLNKVYTGYNFNNIKEDLFGSSRSENNSVGAISQSSVAEKFVIDKSKYGPIWYSTEKTTIEATIINASSKEGELADAIAKAEDGDIILLTDKVYTLNSSLKIDKEITIQSKNTEDKAQLIFVGKEAIPAFEMNPYANLKLNNIRLKSSTNQIAFATLKENMAAPYKLGINNVAIEGFSTVLKAYKGSFADSINMKNTNILNCKKGIILASEKKGDYNAEIVTIENCKIDNVQSDVIHFYRGGYDESTIGGNLTLLNNTFKNCGAKEKGDILIKTRGIVNVTITGNTFQNNPVKLVALLWGEKNNHHKDNTLINSGKIKVEEQLKLDILY